MIINPYMFGAPPLPAEENNSEVVLKLDCWNLYTMFKEQYPSNGIPLTRPAADEDTVGTVYDMGKMGFIWRSIASDGTDRPLLDSDGTRNNMLKFTTGDRLIIPDHKDYFRPLHILTGVFSLRMWVRMDQLDATNVIIVGNSSSFTNGNGFGLRRNSSNKINIIARNPTTTAIVATSTTNVTIAKGWTHVVLNVAGVGASMATLYIDGVLEQTTTTGLLTDAAPDVEFGFGASNFYGAIDGFQILNRLLTTGEIAAAFADNPARASTPYIIRQHDYDFGDAAYVFKDTSQTPATADSVVREVRSKVTSNFGSLFVRKLTSTADANSPVFKINVGGGHNAVRWPGTTGINLEFQVNASDFDFMPENAGNHLLLMIVKNNDPTNGSHTLTGTRYFVLTGEDYAGTGLHTITIHYSDASAPLNLPPEPTDNKYNIIGTYRAGNYGKLFTENGIGGDAGAPGNIGAKFDHIGDAYSVIGSDWNMHGDYVRLIKLNGVISDAQIQQYINHYRSIYSALI